MNLIYTALEWTVGLVICALMIFRYQQFTRIVIYGGLFIATGAGLILVALPLLMISPLLIPVALLVVVIIPIWMVFSD